MLWFNLRVADDTWSREVDFNTSYVVVQRRLMEWYKTIQTVFQYILCCGSTARAANLATGGKKFQYILCCGSTTNSNADIKVSPSFQYILCCGSTQMNMPQLAVK